MEEPFRGKVTDAGRVVIPVELRNAFGLHEGEEVLFSSDAEGIRVTSLTRAIERSRDFFSSLPVIEVVTPADILVGEQRGEDHE